MGHSVTLGGDRVGSGNKNKIYLHNYERSTHNLSEKFTSSLGVGMLVPFLCVPATRDDKFEINLSAGLRTIPTKGPLFGSFKLQLDVYQAPMRLYQALLHNNPLAIGLKANQVKWPKMRLYAEPRENRDEDANYTLLNSANNSLVKYLGISGIGCARKESDEVYRDLLAVPLLAYYDIFKNYYANKQEEYAYTIGHEEKLLNTYNSIIQYVTNSRGSEGWNRPAPNEAIIYENFSSITTFTGELKPIEGIGFPTKEEFINGTVVQIKYTNTAGTYITQEEDTLYGLEESDIIYNIIYNQEQGTWAFTTRTQFVPDTNPRESLYVNGMTIANTETYREEIILDSFKLSKIDDMRMDILSHHQLGQSFIIDGDHELRPPYTNAIGDNMTYNWQKALSGICVKTYQSDLFNNWINTEWIDGENGIAAITAVSTSDGKITIDALNFSEKLYNLLNRIAVSGATYEDYLDAAYTDSAKKFCEAPMWVGGMSDEVVFEEIVQTAPTEGTALGTLGGRGNLLGHKKGGKITIKIDEPSFIIGIVSITPRIQYTQGNAWFNTELDSLQDLHVPALDGIAFQNLLAEQLHYGAQIVLENGEIDERPIIGKVPAWINYMTAVDKAYGDFAAEDGDGYMILNRNYDWDKQTGELIDATTYIDPAKYNYAFAYTKRDAQNFWVQIHSDIKARRLMSAKQIPNV